MVISEHFLWILASESPLFALLHIYNQHGIFMSKNIRAETML